MHFRGCAQCAWNQYTLGKETNEGTQRALDTHASCPGPNPQGRANMSTGTPARMCSLLPTAGWKAVPSVFCYAGYEFKSTSSSRREGSSACSCPEALWPWIRPLQAKAEGSKQSSIGKAHCHTADSPWALSRAHHEKSLCLRRSQRVAVPWCGSAAFRAQNKLPDPAWNSCFSILQGGGITDQGLVLDMCVPKQKHWSKGYEKCFCSTDWNSRQVQKVSRSET